MENVLDLIPLNVLLDFDQYFGIMRSESHLSAKILTKVKKVTFGGPLCP